MLQYARQQERGRESDTVFDSCRAVVYSGNDKIFERGSMMKKVFLFVVSLILFVLITTNRPVEQYEFYESSTSEASETEVREEVWEEWTATAYCPCEKCCGKYAKNRGKVVVGAAGIELIPQKSIAAELPFKSEITAIVNGEERIFVVHDRTARWVAEKYDGKIIDIYFATHEEANIFGKQIIKVRKDW